MSLGSWMMLACGMTLLGAFLGLTENKPKVRWWAVTLFQLAVVVIMSYLLFFVMHHK